MVGAGDGGAIPPEAMPEKTGKESVGTQSLTGADSQIAPGVGQVGFGNAAPPAASTSGGLGESMGTQVPPGHETYAKR